MTRSATEHAFVERFDMRERVGHRARLRGTVRYARAVNHILARNCYGIGACNGDELTRAATI